MTVVYVVVERGVYRHTITGAYTTPEKAREGARQSLGLEIDDYHEFEVVEVPLDAMLVASVDEDKVILTLGKQTAIVQQPIDIATLRKAAERV